jgi:hypothetical protein
MLTCEIHIANQPFCCSTTGNIKVNSSITTERRLQECRDFAIEDEFGETCGWVLDTVVQNRFASTTRLSPSAKIRATLVSGTRFCPKRAVPLNQELTNLFGIQYTNVQLASHRAPDRLLKTRVAGRFKVIHDGLGVIGNNHSPTACLG